MSPPTIVIKKRPQLSSSCAFENVLTILLAMTTTIPAPKPIKNIFPAFDPHPNRFPSQSPSLPVGALGGEGNKALL